MADRTACEPAGDGPAPRSGTKGIPGPLNAAPRDKRLRDVLTHPKTRYVLLVWTPFLALMTGVSLLAGTRALTIAGGMAFGVVVYSVVEYLMHRYLYHWEPESRFLRTITADVGRRHMRHHREPEKMHGAINDRQAPIVVFASLLAVASALVMPWPLGFGLMAIAAGAANYVLQELLHFGTHHLPMRHPLLAAMKRHHMLHHYRDWDMNYGLFWPFWDMILGTHHTSRGKRRASRRTT
jgi:sterol desaturase/sphingolipid hydroxylase (fatty acid hydroxylase superfamily)